MTRERALLIAAGGTGGHLFPAEALALEMKERGYTIHLVTDERGRTYASNFPADELHMTPAATFAGRNPMARIGAVFKILKGISQARSLLKRIKPVAAIGFGGYPSLPAMSAAVMARIPCALHEQNALLGRVNRALAPHMALVACGFEELQRLPAKAVAAKQWVGNPVRAAVLPIRETPYPVPQAEAPFNLLVFGGSQGAQIFGEIVPEAVALLPSALQARLTLTQQVRTEDLERVRDRYTELGVAHTLQDFFTDMPARYGAAHLVLARAGASSVSELAIVGRPALLVPLPGAMDDHQTVNAQALVEAGGAQLLPQSQFTAQSLAEQLTALIGAPASLSAMAAAAKSQGRPHAARDLADLIEGLVSEEAVSASSRPVASGV